MSEQSNALNSDASYDSAGAAADNGQAETEAQPHGQTPVLPGLNRSEMERITGNSAKFSVGSNSTQSAPSLSARTWSARELIVLAQKQPPQPIIKGLMNTGDILLLHGTEESFKSVFVVQCAEAIASGRAFLRTWPVCGSRRVGIIETEMHPAGMGERLTKMFPDGKAPEHIYFMGESLLKQWRRENLAGKFRIIEDWTCDEDIQVLMIDTANDFFRGLDSASEERVVGGFFDRLRDLHLQGRILVRHDRKRREIDDSSHSNEMIRGSSEWKEDPEAIIHLKRVDKRTNEVDMEVGKLRYGVKPEPGKLWFDGGCFRLVPLPPVIAVLESGPITRQELISQCKRFGLSQRAADAQIDENRKFLREGQAGHARTFEIDPSASKTADWSELLQPPKTGPVRDMQSSETSKGTGGPDKGS